MAWWVPTLMVMRVFFIIVLSMTPLAAADEQRLALESKAQTDFERVQKAPVPQLRDTITCIQSQAALLPVASRDGLAAIHYRKGYCTLAGARIANQSSEFSAAAAEFDKAIQNWPARIAAAPKNRPADPLPSALKVMASIARLQAAPDEAGVAREASAIASAENAHECSSPLMEAGFCEAVLRVGRQWLGWISLRRDEMEAAVRDLAGAERSGWSAWALGRKAFRDRNYPEAAAQYGRAVEIWETAKRDAAVTLIDGLGPAPDLKTGHLDLGSAQLLAGDYRAAIENLSRSVKEEPTGAHALFLRARARELAGQDEAAVADYNLASRSAFAAAQDLASGEAHLYRGIVMYHRKDFGRAEDEFASALNFSIPPSFRSDAAAWRHLAAVSAGSCDSSRVNLEHALASVSPYFPKDQARRQMAACLATTAVRPLQDMSK
jgi:tetratricopeptide (TPR) repeat protein